MAHQRREGHREEARELEEGDSSWKYVGLSRSKDKASSECIIGMDQKRDMQGSAKRNSLLKGHVEGTEARTKIIRPTSRGEGRRQGSGGGIYEDVGKMTQEWSWGLSLLIDVI